jgi:hypothetical protein
LPYTCASTWQVINNMQKRPWGDTSMPRITPTLNTSKLFTSKSRVWWIAIVFWGAAEIPSSFSCVEMNYIWMSLLQNDQDRPDETNSALASTGLALSSFSYGIRAIKMPVDPSWIHGSSNNINTWTFWHSFDCVTPGDSWTENRIQSTQ